MSAEIPKSPRQPASARIPAVARQGLSRQADAVRATRAEASPGDASSSGQLSKRKRRHKAAGGRIAASGLGAGALFGIIGALGAHASPSRHATLAVSSPRATPAAAVQRPVPTTTPTTILWRIVHRVVVVTDPPLTLSSSTNVSARRAYAPSYSPSIARTDNNASPAPPPLASPAPIAAPLPAAATPAPAPAPPTCSGTKCP
jgi:hypothetical protein